MEFNFFKIDLGELNLATILFNIFNYKACVSIWLIACIALLVIFIIIVLYPFYQNMTYTSLIKKQFNSLSASAKNMLLECLDPSYKDGYISIAKWSKKEPVAEELKTAGFLWIHEGDYQPDNIHYHLNKPNCEIIKQLISKK